jgi:uncharacterized protein (DUF4415 family)/uncharacterized DUF497 family protein
VENLVTWIWDPEKNVVNHQKHGISFETAALVFDDPLSVTRPDPHPDGDRFRTVGVIGATTVFVVHTLMEFDPDEDDDVGLSSAPARQRRAKGESMKKAATKALTVKQRAELAALDAMPDDQIRTDLIPEQLDWSGAKRGMFYRPVKKQITLRIDADVIEWFRQQAKAEGGYQTQINEVLREYVVARGKG